MAIGHGPSSVASFGIGSCWRRSSVRCRHGPESPIVRRVMALWLPFWPAERRRTGAGMTRLASDATPARIVVALDRGVRRVEATCPGGWAAGIHPGMPLVEARARLAGGTAVEFERDPAGDLRALRRLARWLLGFVPAVSMADHANARESTGLPSMDAEADPRDHADARIRLGSACNPGEHGLFAELTGCGRWLAWAASGASSVPRRAFASPVGFGFDAEAEGCRLETIHRALAERGISSCLATAGTPGAAWAVARFAAGGSSGRVIRPGGEREAIDPLPIESLRLVPAHASMLREVEVRTVCQLLALDRAELADRVRRSDAGSHRIACGTAPREGDESVRPEDSPCGVPRRSSPRFCGGRTPARLAGSLIPRDRSDGPAHAVGTGPSPLDRLDQALGLVPESLSPVPISPRLVVETAFAGPVVDGQTIAIAFAGLVERLCRRLRRTERAVRSLRLRAVPVRGEPWIVPIELGHPTRRPGHLWTIVRPLVESLPTCAMRAGSRRRGTRCRDGTAAALSEGFDAIAIEVIRSSRKPELGADRDLDGIPSPQRSLAGARPVDDPAGFPPAVECLDQLAARFGAERLEVVRSEPGHRPDSDFRHVPWRARRQRGGAKEREPDPRRASDELAGCPDSIRPTWRPPRPEPLTFITDDSFRWRGRVHAVLRIGPAEVFLGRWWGSARPVDGGSGRQILVRRIERRDGLPLWIERDRDPSERLVAIDVACRERLDAVASPACRAASWRVIGIGG